MCQMSPSFALLTSFHEFLADDPPAPSNPSLPRIHMLTDPTLAFFLNPEPQAWAENRNSLLLQDTPSGRTSCPEVEGS